MSLLQFFSPSPTKSPSYPKIGPREPRLNRNKKKCMRPSACVDVRNTDLSTLCAMMLQVEVGRAVVKTSNDSAVRNFAFVISSEGSGKQIAVNYN